jgi:cyclase
VANVRLIGRMDLKMEHLIKGIHLEGWRKVGPPREFARRYYEAGIDELIFMDVVASLYGRNNLADTIRQAAEEMFIPLTVGGGIRSRDDVKVLLNVGADKVAVNTAATQNPDIIRGISDTYGSQATVLSIEAKRRPGGGWEAMTDNGRNHTGLDAIAWAAKGAALGAGEILITSIDQDGTRRGMDIELIRAVTREVSIPVIASGGVGTVAHVIEAFRAGGASAVAIARALHYGDLSLPALREGMNAAGVPVRMLEAA